jgi:hypothetical protein
MGRRKNEICMLCGDGGGVMSIDPLDSLLASTWTRVTQPAKPSVISTRPESFIRSRARRRRNFPLACRLFLAKPQSDSGLSKCD